MTASLPADDHRPIPAVAIIGNDALLAAAPATPVQVAHACLRRGFTVAVPVTWGDELLAAEAVRQLSLRARGPAVMCVCPFVRSRLLAPGPDLAPFLVSLVSPPVATARYLRTIYGDRGVHITYIGACPGAEDPAIDARLTPDAFLGELAEHGISLAEQPLVFDSIVPPDRRRWCSLPGGVPSAEVLWSDTDTRTLVEIERDDVSTDLAQHIIARDHVLLDLAPSLGCSCSGSIPSLTPRSARVAVTALEPPRALGPVIEPLTAIALDVPVFGVTGTVTPELPKAAEPSPIVPERTQQEIDHEARERALDMILGGEAEPPTVPSPARRQAPSRTDVRPPTPPAVARPLEMSMIEPVIARAEQEMAAAMSPLVLETLIDDILIEPLIIPETRPTPAEPSPAKSVEPGVDEAAAPSMSEVVVALDVVREVKSETASVAVRHGNGSAPAQTTAPDRTADHAPADEIAIEIDRARLEPAELPDPSDVDPSSTDGTTAAWAGSEDLADPFDDDEVLVDGDETVEDDQVDAASEIRRRTPPAMPTRHPASAIPKAVSADGRPLPRAYVAKRRVTPAGNTAVPPAKRVVPEQESVIAVGPSPVVETPVEMAGDALEARVQTMEPASTEVGAPETEPMPVPAPESDPRGPRADSERAFVPPPTADDAPPSESVWGVTIEAPVVVNPAAAGAPAPAQTALPRAEPAPEAASPPRAEPRSGSVAAPSSNRTTLITIMVVALVTLAVSVFVLLRR